MSWHCLDCPVEGYDWEMARDHREYTGHRVRSSQ